VVEIASVSDCIAKGPDDWIKSWKFNELGLFDEVALKESVVPSADRSQFDLYAYSFLDERFVDGLVEQWKPPELAGIGPENDFEPLGVVSKAVTDFFECSPLSCNAGRRHSGRMPTAFSRHSTMRSPRPAPSPRVARNPDPSTSIKCCGVAARQAVEP
jgi:hypothetical protein